MPFGDAEALAAAVTDEIAAVVVEPVQGEAGVTSRPRLPGRGPRDQRREHGALLWLDEVQTGIGRTGALVRPPDPRAGVVPDIVTLAKGLGGGVPIGATIAIGEPRAARAGQPRHHLRRQPGRVRRRAGGARHDRGRRPPRRTSPPTGELLRAGLVAARGSPRSAARLLHRARPAGRHRAVLDARTGRRASSSTPHPDADPSRAAAGDRPRGTSRPSLAAWPAILDAAPSEAAHDPPLPGRRRPDPGQQAEVLDLAAAAQGRRRTTQSRSPARSPSR